ncbi:MULTISPECIES: hypothetical protein [Actinomadura]|uniref:Uncharacterized protein n=1 Tax=Actinomadura litoris TaxID=2678616 RepID=A0A7K1KSR3_9ACTN|nr:MULTISPECIES: hypothetical protein [Actinomadura]MBT2207928.1 hypothetical protein [Actinomadura sp. NEAU-AAG7]MUN35228.1 hypothetical protein [Actinomadura litoris]
MSNQTGRNPFHALGLPVDADRELIVERGQEMADLATSDEERDVYRWAVGELIHDEAARRVHAILEVPGTDYDDDRWARFERRHRASPVDPAALRAAGRPSPEVFDIPQIIDVVLDWMLTPPEVDVDEAVRHVPVRPRLDEPPLEVSDVLFG